MHFEFLI